MGEYVHEPPVPPYGSPERGDQPCPKPQTVAVDTWNPRISVAPEMAAPVNYALLNTLAKVPDHPNYHKSRACHHDGGCFCGEAVGEVANIHHLLDLMGVPRDDHGLNESASDERTLHALVGVGVLRERLSRLTIWHSRETGPAGMVGSYCNECGHVWPCDTYKMANGDWTDADDEALG